MSLSQQPELPAEVWTIIIQYMNVIHIMSISQTCHSLHDICNESLIWKHICKELRYYDHLQIIDSLNVRMSRRIAKSYAIFKYISIHRLGDIVDYIPSSTLDPRTLPQNRSASYRMSAFLNSIPESWRILYFSALMDKAVQHWHVVYNASSIHAKGGHYKGVYEIKTRKRRRYIYATRISCTVDWDHTGESFREIPIYRTECVIKSNWAAPILFKTRWRDMMSMI